MKKILSFVLISVLAFTLVSCGNATITGEPTVFTNSASSFSIELPAEKDDSWVSNEETASDFLDVTDKKETVRVVVHCASKAKVAPIANDLQSYSLYSGENIFADFLTNTNTKEASVDTADFITDSSAITYSSNKTEGLVVYMESDKCFYTYLVLAAEGAYKANEKVIQESILSLIEIAEK